jgi:hypothetical protein
MEKKLKTIFGTLVGIIALPITILKLFLLYWGMNSFLLVNLVDTSEWENSDLAVAKLLMFLVGVIVFAVGVGIFSDFFSEEEESTPEGTN